MDGENRYDVEIEYDVEMRARDGAVLRSDIYRPRTSGPIPALVMRTPYGKWRSTAGMGCLTPLRAAANGFAYVIQDTRGRYSSAQDNAEEDADFLGASASLDGYDCIEWVASQRWCDGNVGTVGGSQLGWTQAAAALERPPALKAIAPAIVGPGYPDPFMLEVCVSYGAYMSLDQLDARLARGEVDATAAEQTWKLIRRPDLYTDTLPIVDIPLIEPVVEQFERRHGPRALAAAFDAPRIEVPALCTTGWWDVHGASSITFFNDMRLRAGTDHARRESRLVVGPWQHGPMMCWVGEWYFGIDQMPGFVVDVPGDAHLDFYRRHLRGEGVDLPPVRYFVMGRNSWTTSTEWPPADVQARFFYLRSGGHANSCEGDGVLSEEAPGPAEPCDTYIYDPMHPVPSHGGRYANLQAASATGPYEQHRIEQRSDVLVYTSEPLPMPMEVVGNIEAVLHVSASTPDTDFVVKVCVVDPSGVSVSLADGILRMRFRDGSDGSARMRDGEVYKLRIDLGPTAYAFSVGERVRLQVTSSAFPFYDRNLNTGGSNLREREYAVAHQTIHHEEALLSYLYLPVLGG